ncbi:hypothetical protein ACP275_14G139400 [Erythranthe tilingii]
MVGVWVMGLVVEVGSWVAVVELIKGIATAEGVGIGGGAEEEFGLRKDWNEEQEKSGEMQNLIICS